MSKTRATKSPTCCRGYVTVEVPTGKLGVCGECSSGKTAGHSQIWVDRTPVVVYIKMQRIRIHLRQRRKYQKLDL